MRESLLSRLVGRRWFWALAVAGLFCLPLVRALRRQLPPELPRLGEIGVAQFTAPILAGDRAGQILDATELRDRVWVATFLDPTDPTCDHLANVVAKIQRRGRNLGDSYRIISFVPPAASPVAVTDFATRHRPAPWRWFFVTSPATVENNVRSALVNAGAIPPTMVPSATTVHSRHLAVLVDRAGNIRGFYDLLAAGGLDALMTDIGLVVNL